MTETPLKFLRISFIVWRWFLRNIFIIFLFKWYLYSSLFVSSNMRTFHRSILLIVIWWKSKSASFIVFLSCYLILKQIFVSDFDIFIIDIFCSWYLSKYITLLRRTIWAISCKSFKIRIIWCIFDWEKSFLIRFSLIKLDRHRRVEKCFSLGACRWSQTFNIRSLHFLCVIKIAIFAPHNAFLFCIVLLSIAEII
jgi:hypothetical protein